MRRISPNLFRLRTLYGFAGLVFAAAVANASTVYFNDFEGGEAAAVAAPGGLGVAGQYVYGNQGGWTQTGSAPGNNWWYSTAYATGASPGRPDPFGTTAWHMRSQYGYRVLSDTFVGGAIYEFSVMAAVDAGSVAGTRNVALYLWDGDGGVPGSWDSAAAVGANFYPAGSSTPYLAGLFPGSASFIATPDYNTPGGNNAGNWQELKFQFTAPPSLHGRHIGVGVYGRNNVAIDNLLLSIPEPGTAIVLAGGLLGLISRRRRA